MTADSAEDTEKEQRRAFTSQKLDWLNALAADRRMTAQAFRVGFAIAQRVNMTSGDAFIGTHALSYYVGDMSDSAIKRARRLLIETGWISRHRTSSANRYVLSMANVENIQDYIVMRREEVAEARESRRDRPKVTHRKVADRPEVAHPDRPEVTCPDRPEVTHIHLSSSPSGLHRSVEEGLPRGGSIKEGRACAPVGSAAGPTEPQPLQRFRPVVLEIGK